MALRTVLLVLALAAQPAAAQEGVLRIMLGFPAGATSDILSRLVAEHRIDEDAAAQVVRDLAYRLPKQAYKL